MNRRMWLTVFTGWLIFTWPAFTQQADTDERILTLDPMVVTARGYGTQLSQTPGSVGIITESTVLEREAVSVPNYMDLVPGVSKVSDSAWGSDINIRGLSRGSVVFLIDGCRVNTATDLNAQYGLVDPAEIERIEVLKGPISALYGSGSMGGVVNVITRTGAFTEKPLWRGGLSLNVQSNPEGYSGLGFVNYNAQRWYIYASQTYRDYDSYKDGDGDKMHNSQFRDNQSRLKLGLKWNERNRTEAQIQYFEGHNIGIPGSGTGALPPAADVTYPVIRRVLYNLVHTYAPDGPVFKISRLNLYYQTIDRRVVVDGFPPSTPPPPAPVKIQPGADHDTLGTKWLNEMALEDHYLTLGLDIWQRKLHNSYRTKTLNTGKVIQEQPLPVARYVSGGAFAEDTWQVTERFALNLGGRVDQIHIKNDETPEWKARDEDDTSWNAHLGGTLQLTEQVSAKLMGAHGYRAASLEERYKYLNLGGGTVVWGDPDLDPEQSTSAELGLDWITARGSLSLAAYYNHLDDLIAEQTVDANTRRMANINRAEIYGVEADGRIYLTDEWRLYGNIAWADGRDTRNHEYLPGIAPLNGLAGIRYQDVRGFWGYLETVWAARQDHTPPGVDRVDGWHTVNLHLGWDFAVSHTQQRLYAGVDNLLDESYREYLTTSRGFSFNEPGRSFVGGWQMMF